jgi:hypothetical protein
MPHNILIMLEVAEEDFTPMVPKTAIILEKVWLL